MRLLHSYRGLSQAADTEMTKMLCTLAGLRIHVTVESSGRIHIELWTTSACCSLEVTKVISVHRKRYTDARCA